MWLSTHHPQNLLILGFCSAYNLPARMWRHKPLFAHINAKVLFAISVDREMWRTPGSKGGTGKGGAGPSSLGSSGSRSSRPVVAGGREAEPWLRRS
eukprot:scaffold172176_cov14-Tisochrysis_lutea.AAC.1